MKLESALASQVRVSVVQPRSSALDHNAFLVESEIFSPIMLEMGATSVAWESSTRRGHAYAWLTPHLNETYLPMTLRHDWNTLDQQVILDAMVDKLSALAEELETLDTLDEHEDSVEYVSIADLRLMAAQRHTGPLC